MVSTPSIVGKVGKFNVCFRDVTLSSHAGLVLLDDFAQQLGVAQVLDEELHVKPRERGYRESEAVLSLSHNLISGGSCLLDLDVLRGAVGTRQLLGQARLMAPTTAGEFLRKFDIGDIHDLYHVHRRLQARVRPDPAATCCTLAVDSSVYAQASSHKQGSVKADNGEVGYHPFSCCGPRRANWSLVICAGQCRHVEQIRWVPESRLETLAGGLAQELAGG